MNKVDPIVPQIRLVPHYGNERRKNDDQGMLKVFFFPEILVLCCYHFFVTFGPDMLYTSCTSTTDNICFAAANNTVSTKLYNMYPMLMDLHVMMFIGFGFLSVFLKTHCWASVGFTFLIACWAIQLNPLS